MHLAARRATIPPSRQDKYRVCPAGGEIGLALPRLGRYKGCQMDSAIPMRRLEALSDTVFGVALTFLAYRLPFPGGYPVPAPVLSTLFPRLWPHLAALVLGFSSAGLYWMSHHKRLAINPRLTSPEIFLNFVFLLLISILPVTNDLLGNYGNDGDMVLLYAVHLAALSVLNLLLWVLAVRATRHPGGENLSWRSIISSVFTSTLFVLIALIARWRPAWGEILLFTAFLAPLVARLATRGSPRAPS